MADQKKDSKNVFAKAEKRMERVRFNNYRAERRLKENLEGLNKNERFKMTEIRHQVLLLQMELRSRRCKEAVMILKDGYEENATKKKTPPQKKPEIVIEKPKVEETKRSTIFSAFNQKRHSIWYPRSAYSTHENTGAGETSEIQDSTSQGFPAGRRFSAFMLSTSKKEPDFIRDTKTAPPACMSESPGDRFRKIGGLLKGKVPSSTVESSFSDDDVFSDGEEDNSNSKWKNLGKSSNGENKTLKTLTTLLINSQRLQSVDSATKLEPDMYTDGAMALAMRQLKHKRLATMPSLTGHLPLRKRSVAHETEQSKNGWPNKKGSPTSRLNSRPSKKPSQHNARSGSKTKSKIKEDNSFMPRLHKFTLSTYDFDANRIYIPCKKESTSAQEESRYNQQQIQKLKHVKQAEKYNEDLARIKVFLGGRAPPGSHIDLKELTQEEQYMLKQFKMKTGAVQS